MRTQFGLKIAVLRPQLPADHRTKLVRHLHSRKHFKHNTNLTLRPNPATKVLGTSQTSKFESIFCTCLALPEGFFQAVRSHILLLFHRHLAPKQRCQDELMKMVLYPTQTQVNRVILNDWTKDFEALHLGFIRASRENCSASRAMATVMPEKNEIFLLSFDIFQLHIQNVLCRVRM